MSPFDYIAPTSLDEAVAALDADARPLAGGTDLLTLMHSDLAAPSRLVAIRRLLPRGVDEDAGTLTIGAGTTLAQVADDPIVRARYTALAQAAQAAASPQLRRMATIGGNLLQRPRCWYFRHPHVHCWLKGGDRCQARDGENQRHALFDDSRCVAVHPSDPAVALLALDANVRIVDADGERAVDLEALLRPPDASRRRETTLPDDALITALTVPTHPAETRSAFAKAMDRAAFSFALASVAVVVRLSAHGEVAHARIVLGGVGNVPRRAEAAERALIGRRPEAATLDDAADAALDGARALSRNGYKQPLLRALVRRALAEVTGEASAS